jgi:hypothetical protein
MSGIMIVYKKAPTPGKEYTIFPGGLKKYEFIESPEWANRFLGRIHLRKKKQVKQAKFISRITNKIFRNIKTTVRLPTIVHLNFWQHLDVLKTDTGDTAGNVIAVSVKAKTDCIILTWPVESLLQFVVENHQLKAPLGMIIGADVARKLLKSVGRTSESFHQLQPLVKSEQKSLSACITLTT